MRWTVLVCAAVCLLLTLTTATDDFLDQATRAAHAGDFPGAAALFARALPSMAAALESDSPSGGGATSVAVASAFMDAAFVEAKLGRYASADAVLTTLLGVVGGGAGESGAGESGAGERSGAGAGPRLAALTPDVGTNIRAGLAAGVAAQKVGDHARALRWLTEAGDLLDGASESAVDALGGSVHASLAFFRGVSAEQVGAGADAAAAFVASFEAAPRRAALHRAGLALQGLGETDAAAALWARGVEMGLLRAGLEAQRSDHLDPGLVGAPVWTLEDADPLGMLSSFANSETGMARVVREVKAAVAESGWTALSDLFVATGKGAVEYAHDAELYTCEGGPCPPGVARWHQIPLWEAGSATEAAYVFHETVQALFDHVAPVLDYGRVLFSVLEPGVVIRPHVGPTNTRLTVHCGVSIPDDVPAESLFLRADNETLTWTDGECFVFDDSFEHAVSYLDVGQATADNPGYRVVLIFHIPHPDTTTERL